MDDLTPATAALTAVEALSECGIALHVAEAVVHDLDLIGWEVRRQPRPPAAPLAAALAAFKVSDEDYGESVAIEHDCGWVKVWTWQEVATLAAIVDAATEHLREAHGG